MDTVQRIPTQPVSYDEWLAMPETMLPVDVVDGMVVVSPSPRGLHQVAVENLFGLLAAAAPAGTRAAVAPRDWVLWQVPLRVRQPDVMVVTDAQAKADRLTEAPLLAVEVLSPGSRETDLVHKPAEYAEAGLTHLWLVDPDVPEVVVRRLVDGHWVDVARAEGDQVLEVAEPFSIRLRPRDLTN